MTKKINLLYDATCIAPHLWRGTGTGIYTVAIEVLKEFVVRKNYNIKLYCSENLKSQLKKGLQTSNELKKLKIYNDDNFENIDIFFSPMFMFPKEIMLHKDIQKYLFLHDTIPYFYPKYWENGGNEWFFKMFNGLSAKDFYFTNSQATQNDFMRYNMNVTKDNSIVTPLACDSICTPKKSKINEILKKYSLPTDKKYVFSLCTLEPRKNLIRAVKCFIEFIKKNKIENMVFILGGGHWKGFMDILTKELESLGGYKDKILQAGYIDKEDLPTFYSGAEWFVYTSQYEGFGLPPLEAMACGAPVIVSNNSSLPEVVGDAGILVDWDSDEQHIWAYEKYYFDNKYRNLMAQQGFERSKTFSWKKTVDIMDKQIKIDLFKKKITKKREVNGKINLLYDGNILANAKNKNTSRSGVFFVVYNVLVELIKQNNFNIYLYVNDKNRKEVVDFCNEDERLRGIKAATNANFDEMDAFLSPHADIPDLILQHGHIRTYKITHDFMGCVFDDKIFSTKLENHQRAIHTCSKIFCISENTKNDYLKFVPDTPANKLIVAYEGASERFYKRKSKEVENVKKKLGVNGKYILSVCNLAPHKNLFTAIDAFIDFIKKNKITDLNYLLCGGIPPFYQDEFDKKMETMGKYRDRIILSGYVDDEDIPVLYSGAEWFVFPSLYEGFGLPILEAMKCGTPVVCSNTSSMPEIMGNSGILVEPNSIDDFSKAFNTMYRSQNFRKKCSGAGLVRAKEFSWYNMVQVISNEILAETKTKKQVMPIVLITDENYVRPTIVTITSLLVNKYKNTEYKIYVLCNSVTEKSKNVLNSIEGVEVVEINQAFKEFEGTHQHVSAAALLKFKIADIFPQYDKILYLDTDIIVQHDLSELFNLDLNNKYAAVVKDIECMFFGKHQERLGLKNYFNSGMMLLNTKIMRQDNIYDRLIDYKKKDTAKKFMDQDAFNAVFNNNILCTSVKMNFLPISWELFKNDQLMDFFNISFCEMEYVKKHAYVIHLANKRKPWDYKDVYGSELWAKYYYMSPLKNKAIKYINTNKSKKTLNKSIFQVIGSTRSVTKNEYNILGIKFKIKNNILNKIIKFSELSNNDFNMEGFSVAEKWGRWSNGNHSSLMLNLKNIKKDAVLKFELKPFLHAKHKKQEVDVYANNVKVASWNFEQGKALPKTEFIISKKQLPKNKKCLINFIYKNSISPKDLALSTDSRKLALGFVSMQVLCSHFKEKHLLYTVQQKGDRRKIKVFGLIPLYESSIKSIDNYKKKIFFIGLPILTIKKNGFKKSFRIFGINFSKYDFHRELLQILNNQSQEIVEIKKQILQLNGKIMKIKEIKEP